MTRERRRPSLVRVRQGRSFRVERRWRSHTSSSEQGFTLVELVIAIGLGAVVFAALGAALASGLRALAVQKARTQGNEVATQGIEDLQRLSFDSLVVCSVPAGPVPQGLETTALGSNCPSDTTGYGEDPCNALRPEDAPAPAYTCRRLNIDFRVRRYVAWTDAGRTAKRMAVFVDWTDAAGPHQVSQQSSLRSPTEASIIGASIPSLTSPSATPANSPVTSEGKLTKNLSLSVNATGLGTEDRVFAKFLNLDADGKVVPVTVALDPLSGGSSWTKTILTTDPYIFGSGSQFVTFTGIRASDGKANSVISSAVKFCPDSDTNCSAATFPQFSSITVPSTVALTPSGALKADFSVTAVTKNVAVTDQVQIILATLAGAQALDLRPDTSTCTDSDCKWTATIPKSAGYSFAAGTRKLAFVAAQDRLPPPSISQGSTASALSTDVKFG